MIPSMFRKAMIGDGYTLDLDFTTGVLDSRLTFTRGSTGTRINASGFVETMSNNVARFDHDPTTLAPRGLLVEGTATNLVTYSNDFANANWLVDNSGATNPSVSTVSQTGPDGASTVTRITLNKTGGTFSRIRNSAVGTASQPYTMSVWMKANTASGGAATQNVGLRIGGDFIGFNCVVTTTWKRFQYTYTLSGTDATAQILLWDNIAGNDETADVLVYGCQIELGSIASSYIPTGASTATRNGDFCTMNDITALNYSTTNGTMLYVGQFTKINSASYPTRAGFQQAGGNNPSFEIFTNGSLIFSAARSAAANPERSTTITTNSSIKFATAFDASLASNEVTICLNGGTVLGSSATGLTATYAPTIFALGRAGYELFYPSGTIAQVKYWPTTLPNAQLQSLTT